MYDSIQEKLNLNPQIVLSSCNHRNDDGFSAYQQNGKIHLDANNLRSALFAIETISRYGYKPSMAEKWRPKFKLRPLWLQSLGKDRAFLFQRAVEMGFNAIVADEPLDLPFGLQYIYNAKKSNPWQEIQVPTCDHLLWKSCQNEFRHPQHEDYLHAELLLMEAKKIEGIHPSTLFLCENPTDELVDRINCTCAFSSTDPYWLTLKHSTDTSGTPLLTTFNVGDQNLGGGYWPVSTAFALNQLLSAGAKHNFQGFICLGSHMPRGRSFLDINLSAAGQALWTGHAPETGIPELLTIAAELSTFKEAKAFNAELKAKAEFLVAQIKWLEVTLNKKDPALFEHFIYFARDVRKIILHHSQNLQLGLSCSFSEDDLAESFWAQSQRGEGLRSGTKVFLLDKPHAGLPSSKMSEIYHLNMEC